MPFLSFSKNTYFNLIKDMYDFSKYDYIFIDIGVLYFRYCIYEFI